FIWWYCSRKMQLIDIIDQLVLNDRKNNHNVVIDRFNRSMGLRSNGTKTYYKGFPGMSTPVFMFLPACH
ncbi:hypothetical protein, partial [Escherichia coli]|uniref:hypothetical protein n=1 Tax=Escherichia coli TaxID=562 RepID=UPI001BDC2B3B